MTSRPPPEPKPDPKAERLAQALRANLRRRKVSEVPAPAVAASREDDPQA